MSLIWRATDSVEKKVIESSSSTVVNFVIATNRKYKNKDNNLMEEAEYHRCVAYWNSAEVLSKYLTKWKRIYIEWRLRTRKWQDASGNSKYSTEIIVTHFIFLDNKYTEWEFDNNKEMDMIDDTELMMDEEIPF